MGGHMDRIKSLNEHSNGDEISDTSNMSSSSLNKNSVARALDGRADCLQRLQYFDDAIVDARSAAQLMPTFGQAWRRVGVLAARTGQVAEAWESLFKAVEVDPTDLTSIKMLQKLKWQSKGDAAMQARSEKIVGNGVFAAIRQKQSPITLQHLQQCRFHFSKFRKSVRKKMQDCLPRSCRTVLLLFPGWQFGLQQWRMLRMLFNSLDGKTG